MIEVWKDVVGYEGRYQVSNLGEVRSLPIKSVFKDGQVHYLKGMILKQTFTSTGYKKVELKKDGISKSFKVHRLVAMAFIVNTYEKPFINHKDGNRINNIVDNLEWCTQKENMKHACDTGLRNCIKNRVDHNSVIKDYLNHSSSYVTNKYGISKTVLYGILKEHKIDTHSHVKYDVDLNAMREDILNGMRNVDIAKKYKCSRSLVNTRKCQMRKEGLI